MTLNLATSNARGLKDPSKCAHLLGELLNLIVHVPAMQETHFTCAAECRVMEDDYVFGGARGVMVIVAGCGHGDTSSNPGPD